MQLKDLTQDLVLVAQHGDFSTDILSISYDSRKSTIGSLYVCLPGTKTDGHQYIPQAIDKGIAALVVSKEWWDTQ